MITLNDLKKLNGRQNDIADAKYPTGIIVDLQSPNGNVYALIGLCNSIMRQLALDEEEKKQFKDELDDKNYRDRLQVMEKWFGLVFINKPE